MMLSVLRTEKGGATIKCGAALCLCDRYNK